MLQFFFAYPMRKTLYGTTSPHNSNVGHPGPYITFKSYLIEGVIDSLKQDLLFIKKYPSVAM